MAYPFKVIDKTQVLFNRIHPVEESLRRQTSFKPRTLPDQELNLMERRNLILIIPLIFALTGISLIVVGSIPAESHEPVTLYVGSNSEYKTIQSAVDDAREGDTIVVANGTYRENIIVERYDINIRSNGSATIIASEEKPVVTATEDDFVLSGFKIIGSGVGDVVYVRSDHCGIQHCSITGSGKEREDAGLNIKGEWVWIRFVNVSGCSRGFLIETIGVRDAIYAIADSWMNGPGNFGLETDWGGFVDYCYAFDNSGLGFYFKDCVNLTVCKAESIDNGAGFLWENGRRITISECNASENKGSGIIIKDSKELQIPWIRSENNGGDGLEIESSSWMPGITGVFTNNAKKGVSIVGNCYNFEIMGSNISDNGDLGIECLFKGREKRNDYYMIQFNTIENNGGLGLKITSAPAIGILGNSFIDNNGGKDQAWSDSPCSWFGNVVLNWSEEGGYVNATQGNYWSCFNGSDKDGDDIIDQPYTIPGHSGSKDKFPLAEKRGDFQDLTKDEFWSFFFDFLMDTQFIMRMVNVSNYVNESGGISSDEFEWYRGEEYIGSGDEIYETDDDVQRMGNMFKVSMEDYKTPVKNKRVEGRTNYLIGGIVLVSISFLFASSTFIMFKRTDRKNKLYESIIFVSDEKRHGSDPLCDLREVMDIAVKQRGCRDRRTNSLKNDLERKYGSGEIDRQTYDEMNEILNRKG
jgi:nitrous oxidase accessory protein NosD